MKKIYFLLLFLVSFTFSFGQYFQTGQDPASIRWRQINTSNFQLIYPDYFENQAQKLGFILEKVYNYNSNSIPHKPKKISVILHTQTVKSNGLVAWAPKRSEFFTSPHQDIYAQDWLEQLVIHEFRHVVQVDKINSLMPGILRAILGEQGTALIFGVYLPWWLIEGDAVVTETALSNYGRGRLPSFLMEHKAQVVEKGIWSYDKAYNGSYRNHVPDHYKLGYYLTGEARNRFGAGLWDSVLTLVGKVPYSPNIFNRALKAMTGMKKVAFYNSVFGDLKKEWLLEDKNFIHNKIIEVSPPNKQVTNYEYNHFLNDSVIICYRTSFNKIPAFVAIDKDKKQTILHQPGEIFSGSVNYRNELIVWSEQVPDARWSHSGRSKIKVFNIKTRTVTGFYPEYKAFAPAISPDKTNIALVESDFKNNYFLTVYSISEGKKISRIQSPENYLFSPEWLDNNTLALIMLTNQGKRLAKADLETGTIQVVSDIDFGEIKHLKMAGNELLFVSGYSGKDALYSFNLNNGSIVQLYEPRFGCDFPSEYNGKIILSDYTSDGYRLISFIRNESNSIPFDRVKKGNFRLADALAKQENGIPVFNLVDTTSYESKPYRKASHLVNIHSWAPVYIDSDTYEFAPGASVMSQNKLGTAEIFAGYRWDYSEKSGRYYAKYSYKGWYPVLDFDANSGKSQSQYRVIQQYKNSRGEIVKTDTVTKKLIRQTTNLSTTIRIPLNLSSGKYRRLLEPMARYSVSNYKAKDSNPDSLFEGNVNSVTYRLYFHQLLSQSYRDVLPNFGIVTDLSFRHTPFGINDMGSLTAFQSFVYLPGFAPTHGIKIYFGAHCKKINGIFYFGDGVKYPRGWGKINTKEMISLAFDYKLPLFYPEWSLGGLAYLKRVNASLFADYGALKGYIFKSQQVKGTFEKQISSTGIELMGDVHFLRFYAPTQVGVRSTYIPANKRVYFDFLFSIDFTSL